MKNFKMVTEDFKDVIYSDFLDQLFKFVFVDVVNMFITMQVDAKGLKGKFTMGAILCKSIETLLQKFLINLKRFPLDK